MEYWSNGVIGGKPILHHSMLGCRGVAQLVSAPASKVGGRGFESCHPCQAGGYEECNA